ncbi:MAG: hypothetical protein IPK82_34550 [Polyangiaceae bacterium]|nr:hypothetical protein [Polyangiaceae bacterium]
MIDNTQFWFDITRQLDEWRYSGANRKHYTGYGGRGMVNETISAFDFATCKKQWRDHAANVGMETRIAKSGSGLEQGVFDFICHEHGKAHAAFVYHIIVQGARDEYGEASPWVDIF